MSRFNSSGAHSHSVRRIGRGRFRLSWVIDRYSANSRLRNPATYTRDTDAAGALKFARKWNGKNHGLLVRIEALIDGQ